MGIELYFNLLKCIALLALVAGVATGQAQAGDLKVNFELTASDRCSSISPEIRVANVPAGTVSFNVRLRDHDAPDWQHGGGTVPANAAGVIPRGVLQDGYNGPCPPEGSHTYEFTVKALNAGGDALAEGSATRRFP